MGYSNWITGVWQRDYLAKYELGLGKLNGCAASRDQQLSHYHPQVWRSQRQRPGNGQQRGQLYEEVFSFVLFLRFYLFIFRERGRKKEREGNQCVAAPCTPYWGPGTQPRHVLWLGIKPATFCFSLWCSIHWVTPARAREVFVTEAETFSEGMQPFHRYTAGGNQGKTPWLDCSPFLQSPIPPDAQDKGPTDDNQAGSGQGAG